MAVITRQPAAEHSLRVKLVVVLLMCVIGAEWAIWLAGQAHKSAPPATTVTTPAAGGAVAVSEAGLQTLASLGRSIYWAGPKSSDTYELTQHPDGRIYVRYLPAGTPIGSPKIFRTVASYPVVNAYAVTKTVSRQQGSVKVAVPGGGIAFYRSPLPTNIYVAYPGSDYQVEVFDPSPEEAATLVSSGAIQEVEGAAGGATVPKSAAVAVRPGQLASLAKRLGRPLYWAGARVQTTYELTQTPDGRVYVRYLPAGVAVATQQPYFTVATYPIANAYATTKKAAAQKGSVPIRVPGGVAYYSTSRPASVYIAFPGVDEQIEVFDPSPARVHAAVAAHLIRPVP